MTSVQRGRYFLAQGGPILPARAGPILHARRQNHILPVFGGFPITEINRGMVKKFLFKKLKEDYAISTTCHMRDVMSGVFRAAIDDEIIASNPTYRLGRPFTSKRNLNNTINPLTAEELRHLLEVVKMEYPEHFPLFLLLARTGMRIGEALVVEWGDIDFRGRFINVQRGIVRGKIDTPKNGKARPVDMSLQLAETLKWHRVESKKKGLGLGLGGCPEYVFTNEKGGLLDKDNWRRRVFNKALEKAELRRIRIHDMRHTYATLRISKGDNVADVSKQLGHHSPQLTLDIYYHWMPGKKKDEVDGLDDLGEAQPNATYTQPKEKRG